MRSTPAPLLRALLASLVAVTLATGVAWAFWTTTAAPGSSGGSRSASVNQVATPTASASGRAVTITWAASTLSNYVPVDGYLVRRYDATTLKQQAIGPGCTGTRTSTTCTETAVPAGQWVYSVTPVLAANWRGPESVKSTPVTVASPTLELSSSTVRPGTSVTGAARGFLPGETLRFRLDAPTGTELAGSIAGLATPTAIPPGGGGSVTVAVPAGTTDGPHQLYAVTSPSGDAARADVVVDGTPPPPPVLTQTPSNPSGGTVTFGFTDSEVSAILECRLDGALFTGCTSPMTYADLSAGSHTFQVRATDTVGNISTVASHTWTVNLTVPTISIDFPQANASYNDAGLAAGCAPTLVDVCGTAEDNEGVKAVKVSLRQVSTGSYWTPQGFTSSTETWHAASGTDGWSWIAPSSLPEGDYVLRAQASDGSNIGYDTTTFTVDRTPPAPPTISAGPPPTSGGSVGLAFTTTDPTDTFQCRLDSGAWQPCVSPQRYEGMSDGSHTLSVRAVDRAGNTSGATSRTWTVDATAPVGALTFPATGPYNRASWAAGCGTPTTGDICGTASDTGSGVVAVAVSIRHVASDSYWDGSAFAAPSETWLTAVGTTAWTYAFDAASFPSDGRYTIRWRATDKAGNATTGAVTLTVDTTPPPAPVIVQAPHDPGGPSAVFDFTDTEADTGFQCQLDSGAWSTCTAPARYSGLADGRHTFGVRAMDAAGNTSAASSYSWTVDTGVPSVNITAPAGGRTYNDAGYNAACGTPIGDICGTAADPQGNLAAVDITLLREATQLYWDGTGFRSPTQVHLPVSGLSSWSYAIPAAAFPGDESFTVTARATDSVGLTAVDSVTITFDRTAPAAPTITSGPTGTTAGNDTFTFTSEPGARFECRLDAAGWTSCASPKRYGVLADGPHTFEVRAVDAAGNTGAPASRTWTVDTTAPAISTTFPAAGGRYNNATFDAGCVAGVGDLCGTTSDALSGAAKVEISMQRASAGLYLSGSTFSSSVQTWTTANGTTSWNLPLAATTFPADDTYTLTVRATDGVGNVRTSSTAFVIDRTKPTAVGFTTTNGGTAGKMEAKDTFTLTFSEPVDPRSISSGWDGTSALNVVVHASRPFLGNTSLTVYDATNKILLPLGTVKMNRRYNSLFNYEATFGEAPGTPSKLVMSGSSLTITLGTAKGSMDTVSGGRNATWTPSAMVLDLAGNAASTTPYTETDNDLDF